MRRIVAISLVFLYAWTFAAPLFASSAKFTLPACCRTDGKHHCTMRAAPRNETAPGISTIGEKCRSLPKAVAVSQHRAWSTAPAQIASAAAFAHPYDRAQNEARYRIAFSRSRQKRGPPVTA